MAGAARVPPSHRQAAAAEAVGQKTILPGQTPAGQHILGVLLKRTYDVVPGKRCVRAAADRKLIPGDTHYGDPMNSSVEFESDFVPFKLATDVVLNGHACTPNGGRVDALTVSLTVGRFRKDALVIGDRSARHTSGRAPMFTDPQPFALMPLRYERAYGGVDIHSDPKMPCIYPRNHLGRGFVIANTWQAVDDLPLPNIEDPTDRLTPDRLCVGHFMHWENQPFPEGFGWFAKMWRPRALLAGVMPADRAVEQQLRKVYAQAVPAAQRPMYEQTRLPDMDFRFFNGASRTLALPYLTGDELVRLTNLDPEGEIAFHLPGERPGIGLDIGFGVEEPEVVLQTVMIRADERQVDLVWRGAVGYPGPDWLPGMTKMEVFIR